MLKLQFLAVVLDYFYYELNSYLSKIFPQVTCFTLDALFMEVPIVHYLVILALLQAQQVSMVVSALFFLMCVNVYV